MFPLGLRQCWWKTRQENQDWWSTISRDNFGEIFVIICITVYLEKEFSDCHPASNYPDHNRLQRNVIDLQWHARADISHDSSAVPSSSSCDGNPFINSDSKMQKSDSFRQSVIIIMCFPRQNEVIFQKELGQRNSGWKPLFLRHRTRINSELLLQLN